MTDDRQPSTVNDYKECLYNLDAYQNSGVRIQEQEKLSIWLSEFTYDYTSFSCKSLSDLNKS
jgi:hypothetical protein